MKYLAVCDREDGWRIIGKMPWRYETNRRGKTTSSGQANHIYPKPERVSCFVTAHQIIEAESEEEACRLASTSPRVRFATPSRSL